MAAGAWAEGESDGPVVIWEGQARQNAFITCPADDTGFGGARGGGKTDGVVGDFIDHEDTYGHHAIGMVFRRERTQLVELIERAKQIMLPIGYKWHEQDKYFRGPQGGRLRCTYLENDSDADAYQGHSYSRLYPEEMGTFPSEAPINKLQATLRSGQGVPCKMKGTCNPGGPGHQWVKSRYKLDQYPSGFRMFETEYENPYTKKKITKTRMFIPSKIQDNQFLGDDYVANLFQVGSPALVKAWLEGDWNVVEGAFFPEFSTERHIVKPHSISDTWLKFRCGDWGSAAPFAVYWIAVAGDSDIYPRGALVVYREWYGVKIEENGQFKANVGLKLDAQEFGRQGALKDGADTIQYGVLDPSAFKEDGGPSIAERMIVAGWRHWQRADNQRVPGWDQVRARLAGDGDGRPMLYVFDTCTHLIRTLPALQHDEHKPEDVDTESEDHAGDALRYGCMSRPYVKKVAVPKVVPGVIIGGKSTMTLDQAYKRAERMRRGSGGRI